MTSITGIAAISRVSTNGHFYPPQELAKLSGKTVPLLFHHHGHPDDITSPIEQDKIIGTATVHWDAWMTQLTYIAEVDKGFEYLLTEYPKLGASIGTRGRQHDIKTANGIVKFISNLVLVELSLTPVPAIPETTMKLSEYAYSDLASLDSVSRMKLDAARARAAENEEYRKKYVNFSGVLKINHKPFDHTDPHHRELADYAADYKRYNAALPLAEEAKPASNPNVFKKKVKVAYHF